jgi:hypothetical protein
MTMANPIATHTDTPAAAGASGASGFFGPPLRVRLARPGVFRLVVAGERGRDAVGEFLRPLVAGERRQRAAVRRLEVHARPGEVADQLVTRGEVRQLHLDAAEPRRE